jgi:hypothetical protein
MVAQRQRIVFLDDHFSGETGGITTRRLAAVDLAGFIIGAVTMKTQQHQHHVDVRRR